MWSERRNPATLRLEVKLKMFDTYEWCAIDPQDWAELSPQSLGGEVAVYDITVPPATSAPVSNAIGVPDQIRETARSSAAYPVQAAGAALDRLSISNSQTQAQAQAATPQPQPAPLSTSSNRTSAASSPTQNRSSITNTQASQTYARTQAAPATGSAQTLYSLGGAQSQAQPQVQTYGVPGLQGTGGVGAAGGAPRYTLIIPASLL